jgi:hypothetical protein
MTDDDYPPLPAWAYHPLAPLAAFAADAARKEGDWELLIQFIREDGPITDDVRAVILDIITGKLKRPKKRPKDKNKPALYLRIAYAVEY